MFSENHGNVGCKQYGPGLVVAGSTVVVVTRCFAGISNSRLRTRDRSGLVIHFASSILGISKVHYVDCSSYIMSSR